MELIEKTLGGYHGRARIGEGKTKTGKSIKIPNFMPKISRKESNSKVDVELLQNAQWVDTVVIDLPFMQRWESSTIEENKELKRSKATLLDLRTDKLLSGDTTFLEGFRDVLSEKTQQGSDAIDRILRRLIDYCDKKDKDIRLTEADITPSFIDDFIETIIKKDEYDIITAPYFKMKSTSPLSRIINLNKECITKTNKKMNQLGIEKDILGVICISPGLLQNKEAWDSIFELLDMDVDMWGIRLSSFNFETKDILPFLWEFIDRIVLKIGAKSLIGLDFELYDSGPFGFPLLTIGLDAFSSGICETDEVRRKKKPPKEKPFGFYYLRKKRVKKHVKKVLPNDIQECGCPVCRELVTDLFNEPLDKNALQAKLKETKSIDLKKKMKRHFLHCREQEIIEYEEIIENRDFLTIMKDIARNSSHSDWEGVLDQSG